MFVNHNTALYTVETEGTGSPARLPGVEPGSSELERGLQAGHRTSLGLSHLSGQ